MAHHGKRWLPPLTLPSLQYPNKPPHPAVIHRQAVLNNAGYLSPEHECYPPIPITARIVWERDGEEHIDTVALGWSGRLVYVQLLNRRNATKCVWLRAEDVRRR